MHVEQEMARVTREAREAAILEERERMAGEIHDNLAQSFATISMQLAAAETALDGPDGDFVRDRFSH